MIILGEDKKTLSLKINKKYFVSDDGTIFDKNFKQMKTYIDKNGYEKFLSVPVHKIVKYTLHGYRDGNKFIIHHLDGNKLNNHIDNLVYLTNSEHVNFHLNKKFQESLLNHLVSF